MGSTEPHYTPSKAYQGVLSKRPILAVLHKDSTAVNMLEDAGAGIVLGFAGESDTKKIYDNCMDVWNRFGIYAKQFNSYSVKQEVFDQYSAKAVTQQLATLLNQLTEQE